MKAFLSLSADERLAHLTFKGGTSLSKAWRLIERFSEDIDLVVDKEVLGFGCDAAPDKAPSKKQRKARLECLMTASRQWVQGTLQPALSNRIQTALGDTNWKLEVDPGMPDGQCLLFHYPSVFPPGSAGYVRPVVKIRFNAGLLAQPKHRDANRKQQLCLKPPDCCKCLEVRTSKMAPEVGLEPTTT